jgi:hypothetical protein
MLTVKKIRTTNARAMEYRVLDSEYHPYTFRDQDATKLDYTITNLQIALYDVNSGKMVSASKGA